MGTDSTDLGDIDSEELNRISDRPLPSRLLSYLKLLGPGFMVTAIFVGGATVVTASTLGAAYGMSWLWVAVAGVIAYGGVLWGITQVTLHTEENFFTLCKNEIHPIAFIAALISLFVANTIFGITQIYLSVSIIQAGLGISVIPSVLITIVITGIITFGGSDRGFIKILGWVMQGMIWLLIIIFLATFLSIQVDWGEIVLGLIPTSLPRGQAATTVGAFVAATVGIQTFLMYTTGLREREWTSDHFLLGKMESVINPLIYLIASFLLIAIFAFTLGRAGIQVEGAVGASLALEPFAGQFSTAVFLFGVWIAVISSLSMDVTMTGQIGSLAFPNTISPIVSDNSFKIAASSLFIFAAIVPLINTNPFSFLIYATSFNALFTPFFVLFLIYLINSSKVMNEMTANLSTNILLIFAFIVSLIGAGATFAGQII